ncbi:MAG: Hsp33 family molecular chaperone HslO [Acidiferrobacterales bacterium]
MFFDNDRARANDSSQRFLFEPDAVRGEIVRLGATWRAVLERRDYPPALRLLLGEAMAATALLTATVKLAGRVVMQIQGKGPITLLVVECTSDQTMRAMAKWTGRVPEGPLSVLVGNGQLAITLEPSEGRERYQGIVELVGETIADALENYFVRSEQLQTRLWLAADHNQAAGMLLQRLPADGIVDPETWFRAVQLGSTITRKELLALPAREIIYRLYHEEDIRVFDSIPFGFRCSCSRGRVSNVLRLLGPDEVGSILEEQGLIRTNCEFCLQQYNFDRVDAKQIFVANVIPSVSAKIH